MFGIKSSVQQFSTEEFANKEERIQKCHVYRNAATLLIKQEQQMSEYSEETIHLYEVNI